MLQFLKKIVKVFSLSLLMEALGRSSIQFMERIIEGTGKNSYKGLKVTVTKGRPGHLTDLRIVKKMYVCRARSRFTLYTNIYFVQ